MVSADGPWPITGKSTLMQCVAGLDRLTTGSAFIGDTDLSGLDRTQLTLLRRDRLGFIFQQYNLIPTLTARENMLLPLTLAGRDPDEAWFGAVPSRRSTRLDVLDALQAT